MPDVEDTPIVPKVEHDREGSVSSIESSPGPDLDAELDGHPSAPASVQVQKRKGGRKPIYATSEERKQRNRQAQAAFRERRTEYIKQLETTIKHQDETLQSLQQSHRSAADECLMLRYKNSLLERILLEKGIDVQAELKTKEIAAPGKIPPSLPQPSPIQRAVMNRHSHAQRNSTGGAASLLQKSAANLPNHSPQLQPTPPSQTSSPSTSRSPVFGVQGGMNPPHAGFQAQPQPQPPQLKGPPYPGISIPNTTSSNSLNGSLAPNPNTNGHRNAAQRPAHWPSPYQTHIEQLEQEYDAHADMLDDTDPSDEATGPGPYPQPSYAQQQQPPVPPFNGVQHASLLGAHQAALADGPFDPASGGQMFDPFDPMLDADPFGLTASMHFPTQFSFQESSMRK